MACKWTLFVANAAGSEDTFINLDDRTQSYFWDLSISGQTDLPLSIDPDWKNKELIVVALAPQDDPSCIDQGAKFKTLKHLVENPDFYDNLSDASEQAIEDTDPDTDQDGDGAEASIGFFGIDLFGIPLWLLIVLGVVILKPGKHVRKR